MYNQVLRYNKTFINGWLYTTTAHHIKTIKKINKYMHDMSKYVCVILSESELLFNKPSSYFFFLF